ncbi:WAT1-related protein At1g68170 [Ricinus communis]|uniref:WAT1-related protein n=1 Tax=Ricinus communis TaxID=3988 RepID=B9SYA8_RICCO|nr:WAT1-related protein At1g68170 [Ricinus communis]XP_015581968.1 WAT1-related protein At1g68170 [Ricinus communis]EEF31412.1 Auxin-induced protein 5NG4, putative [Ricinus communis]|eukprot:XP_002530977.1 WAT1-related protein At1g68170 [Ricinus communis]
MKVMVEICNLADGVKAVLVMVTIQVAYTAVNVLYKLAASDGMSVRIITAYRFIFATAFMVPLALIFERKNRPKLTWTILFQAFFCGLFGGSLSQNMYLESLVLTSATFATAIFNLVPAVTFILAFSFGLEKVEIRTPPGKAKVIGTLLGISGAMLLTFYKGTEINIWRTHINLIKDYQSHEGGLASSDHHHHGSLALGSLLAVANCFSYAFWLIIQAKMSERYPCPYSSTALMSFMASIQAVVYALCVEKDFEQWKLGWNIRLLTAAYAGIAVAGIMVTLVIWCVRLKGPLFVSIFSPLLLICTAIAGSILLNETLHLGSILGGTLIICGLYGVLWAKSLEMKIVSQLVPFKSCREGEKIEVVISTPKNDSNFNVENCSAKHDEQ